MHINTSKAPKATWRRRSLMVGLALVSTLPLAAATQAAAEQAAVVCPTSVSVPAKALTLYPSRTAGDTDFGGNGPAITVSAKREKWDGSSDYLSAVIRMRAEETKSDWTAADGTKSFVLYLAPAGCNIDTRSLAYGSFDSNGYLAKTSSADPRQLAAGDASINPSFVSGYTVWDDHSGRDIDTYTRVQVKTRAFTVHFTN